MHRTIALAAAVAALALLASLSHVAPADAALRVGLADQKPRTFTDPLFVRLDVERTRYIVAWNSINKASERPFVDEWMRAARARRLEIMVAFNHSSGDRCPARPCSMPSVRSYRRAVTRFKRRYPFVRIYQPWNESNSRTQPTTGRRGARRVAQYYRALRSVCRRRCTVTGADIQDIGRFTTYARDFLRYAGRARPRIMGFHNYTDTNRRSYRNTAAFVRAMPRGTKVWLTETGGLYSFTQQDGTVSLPPSEARQARAMTHMFRIARRYSRSIDRIYVYQWNVNFGGDRFDAGVVNPDGSPRRAYDVLLRHRRYFR